MMEKSRLRPRFRVCAGDEKGRDDEMSHSKASQGQERAQDGSSIPGGPPWGCRQYIFLGRNARVENKCPTGRWTVYLDLIQPGLLEAKVEGRDGQPKVRW